MKRALILASVASMIDQFNMDNIKILQKLGYRVDVLCNFDFGSTISNERIKELKNELSLINVDCYNVLIPRSILSIKQLFVAYGKIKKIIKNNRYNIVHCHSPVGGVLGRLACKTERKKGLRVLYTAHGFHFYKGAFPLNWFIYYPIELVCSYITDCLITINNEDFNLAQKKMKCKEIVFIPGVGINVKSFSSKKIDLKKKKEDLGLPVDGFVLLSVGELNKNKNHQVVIRALSEIDSNNIHYLIAGEGVLKNYLKKIANKLKIGENIHLLGYRRDVNELLQVADIFCHPSYREGMPVSVMEAMAAGLPVVGSNIRGVNDCCEDNINGILCDPRKAEDFSGAINRLVNNKKEIIIMGGKSSDRVTNYDITNVNKIMKEIYKNQTGESIDGK